MHVKSFVLAAAFTGLVASQSIDTNDYPSACQQACQPIADQSSTCDQENSEDAQELNCICTGPGIESALQECAQCVAQNGGNPDNDDDNDDSNGM